MKRMLVGVTIAAAVAVSVSAVPAGAATPTDRQLKALTKRVTALEKKVKTLETQNRRLQSAVGAALTVAFCNTVITADAIQGTWAAIDTFTQASSTPRAVFGPQTAVSDPANTCADLRVTRMPVQANIAPFSALLALLA